MNRRIVLAGLALGSILLLTCAEKTPEYPWIHDPGTHVDAQGKLVGYEFSAKW